MKWLRGPAALVVPFLLGALWPVAAQGQTTVSGTIAENTTWTRDGSPYLIVGETKVANAATLTIESGVVVEAQGRYVIEVAGTVDANGTADAPVRFSCIRYVPQCWFGFEVVPSGVLSLDHSEVAFAGAGVETAKGKVIISNSRVHHNGTGLRLGGAEVTSTLIDYNNTGVEVTAPFTSFDKNTITGNEVGLESQGLDDKYQNNNIYGNVQDNLSTCGFGPATRQVDATNNWWGSTDSAAIEASICHQVDEPDAPKVTFDPFVNGPITGGAPTSSPKGSPRALKFWLWRHLAMKGSISGDPAYPGCIRNVTVVVQRRVGKVWKDTRSFKTADNGKFRGRLVDKSGQYRAFAPEIEGVCAAAVSQQRTHRE